MRTRSKRKGLVGVTVGVLIAMAATGYGIAQASDSEDSAMVAGEPKGEAYCTQYPDMCPTNPTTPVPVNPEWLQRFEDADRGDRVAFDEAAEWSEEDAARLQAGIEALDCAEAVPDAATQEQADAALRARTAADLQPILDEYWALSSREAVAEDWLVGVAIGASAGRHAPVGCRLHDFQVQEVRSDAEGLIVYVRYQTQKRFLDRAAGARAAPDGWELPNDGLEYGFILEVERDLAGRIMILSDNHYKDLALGDSGI